MASDWADERATQVLRGLKGLNPYYNHGRSIDELAIVFREIKAEGVAEGMERIAAIVQDHAEGGDIENYLILSDKIDSAKEPTKVKTTGD